MHFARRFSRHRQTDITREPFPRAQPLLCAILPRPAGGVHCSRQGAAQHGTSAGSAEINADARVWIRSRVTPLRRCEHYVRFMRRAPREKELAEKQFRLRHVPHSSVPRHQAAQRHKLHRLSRQHNGKEPLRSHATPFSLRKIPTPPHTPNPAIKPHQPPDPRARCPGTKPRSGAKSAAPVTSTTARNLCDLEQLHLSLRKIPTRPTRQTQPSSPINHPSPNPRVRRLGTKPRSGMKSTAPVASPSARNLCDLTQLHYLCAKSQLYPYPRPNRSPTRQTPAPHSPKRSSARHRRAIANSARLPESATTLNASPGPSSTTASGSNAKSLSRSYSTASASSAPLRPTSSSSRPPPGNQIGRAHPANP